MPTLMAEEGDLARMPHVSVLPGVRQVVKVPRPRPSSEIGPHACRGIARAPTVLTETVRCGLARLIILAPESTDSAALRNPDNLASPLLPDAAAMPTNLPFQC
jgi:hypothetical protein